MQETMGLEELVVSIDQNFENSGDSVGQSSWPSPSCQLCFHLFALLGFQVQLLLLFKNKIAAEFCRNISGLDDQTHCHYEFFWSLELKLHSRKLNFVRLFSYSLYLLQVMVNTSWLGCSSIEVSHIAWSSGRTLKFSFLIAPFTPMCHEQKPKTVPGEMTK